MAVALASGGDNSFLNDSVESVMHPREELTKLNLQVNLLQQMVVTQQRLLSNEKRNSDALKWELLLAQGIGEAQQKDIVEGVSASMVEKLGEGAAPLLLGMEGGAGSWEDDKFSVVSMLALARYGGGEDLRQRAGGREGKVVTEKALGDFFVKEFPSMRPDYMRDAVKWLLETTGSGTAEDVNVDDLWAAMGRYAVEDDRLQLLCQRVHDVDQTLLVLPADPSTAAAAAAEGDSAEKDAKVAALQEQVDELTARAVEAEAALAELKAKVATTSGGSSGRGGGGSSSSSSAPGATGEGTAGVAETKSADVDDESGPAAALSDAPGAEEAASAPEAKKKAKKSCVIS